MGDRRILSRPVTAERRGGQERRYWEERRAGSRRRSLEQQAAAVGDPGLRDRAAERERGRAKRLLADFMAMSGPADQRLAKLVRRQWPAYPLGARALLVESLTPILSPVTDGTPLTDEVRRVVEGIVVDWGARL